MVDVVLVVFNVNVNAVVVVIKVNFVVVDEVDVAVVVQS